MEPEAGRTVGIVRYIFGLLGQQAGRGLETIVCSFAIVVVCLFDFEFICYSTGKLQCRIAEMPFGRMFLSNAGTGADWGENVCVFSKATGHVSYAKSVFAAIIDINLQISKNLPVQTLLFSCINFVSRWMRCAVKILEDFTEGNSRLSQIKP